MSLQPRTEEGLLPPEQRKPKLGSCVWEGEQQACLHLSESLPRIFLVSPSKEEEADGQAGKL